MSDEVCWDCRKLRSVILRDAQDIQMADVLEGFSSGRQTRYRAAGFLVRFV